MFEQHAEKDLVARKLLHRYILAGGVAGAIGALALPSLALAHDEHQDEHSDELPGLWLNVISALDNSFPTFQAFELYGAGIFIGTGNADLNPQSLSSSAFGIWENAGERKFRLTLRFWTYNPSAMPTGFIANDVEITLSEDGNTFIRHRLVAIFRHQREPYGSVIPNPGKRHTHQVRLMRLLWPRPPGV